MAPKDDPRPSEPSTIITAIWHTDADETCTVKVVYAERIDIYGDVVNITKRNQRDWEYTAPPNHTCTLIEGEGVTFKKTENEWSMLYILNETTSLE